MSVTTDSQNVIVDHCGRYDEILSRLENCEGMVISELDEYRQSLDELVFQKASEFKLSIIIPVYNEETTIARVLTRVAALPLNTEIIVVDDNSQDAVSYTHLTLPTIYSV